MLIWVLPIDKNDNHTDIYDGKMANCCQKVRGNKTKQRPKQQQKTNKQTNKQAKQQKQNINNKKLKQNNNNNINKQQNGRSLKWAHLWFTMRVVPNKPSHFCGR